MATCDKYVADKSCFTACRIHGHWNVKRQKEKDKKDNTKRKNECAIKAINLNH